MSYDPYELLRFRERDDMHAIQERLVDFDLFYPGYDPANGMTCMQSDGMTSIQRVVFRGYDPANGMTCMQFCPIIDGAICCSLVTIPRTG